MRTSREGRMVPARNAVVRKEAATATLCARCVHLLDRCTRVKRVTHVNPKKFVIVHACDGYESIEGQKASE